MVEIGFKGKHAILVAPFLFSPRRPLPENHAGFL